MKGYKKMNDDNYLMAIEHAHAEQAPTVGYDTDGTAWMTVRYVIDVQVMTDDAEDALYHAEFMLQDNLHNAQGRVL
jgi:hypothetical protein